MDQVAWESRFLPGVANVVVFLKPSHKGLKIDLWQRYHGMNRDFFFDQYVGLLLLYFFTPAVAALRGLQKITGLVSVCRHLNAQACPVVPSRKSGNRVRP